MKWNKGRMTAKLVESTCEILSKCLTYSASKEKVCT